MIEKKYVYFYFILREKKECWHEKNFHTVLPMFSKRIYETVCVGPPVLSSPFSVLRLNSWRRLCVYGWVCKNGLFFFKERLQMCKLWHTNNTIDSGKDSATNKTNTHQRTSRGGKSQNNIVFVLTFMMRWKSSLASPPTFFSLDVLPVTHFFHIHFVLLDG